MKKLFFSAMLAFMALSSNAATDYVVFSGDELSSGETAIPLGAYYAWNGAYTLTGMVDDATSPDGKSMLCTVTAADSWFGGGWLCDESFDMSQLHTEKMALVLYAKSTGSTIWKVKLTGENAASQELGNTEVSLNLNCDGNWHKVVIPLKDEMPGFYNTLTDAVKGYIFTVVGNNNVVGDELYITDVRYSENEEKEVDTRFQTGNNWYGTFSDVVAPVDREEKYNVTADYTFTANEDNTLGITVEFTGAENAGMGHSVHVVSTHGDEWVNLTKVEGEADLWIGKTELTFHLGEALPVVEIYCPYAGNVFNELINDYVYGAANEAPSKDPAVVLTAEAQNVTYNSAEIVYDVLVRNYNGTAAPVVYIDGKVAGASPLALTDLAEVTEYTHTLKAVLTVDGVEYSSPEVTVSFKTPSQFARAITWHGIADGILKNAYFVGESEDMSRPVPVSILVEAIYNVDKTITVNASVKSAGEVVGLVAPNIVLVGNPRRDGQPDHTPMQGTWSNATYTTTGTYEEGDVIEWFTFDLIYANGGYDNIASLNNKFVVGDENDAVVVGAPAILDLELSTASLKVGESAFVSATAEDAEGHFIFDTPTVVTVSGDAFKVDGRAITALKKGEATVTATCGDITATATLACTLSADGHRLDYASLYSDHNEPALAFDNNEGTEVNWTAETGDGHFLVVDLGVLRAIESIEMVWEGASAGDYTVTVSTQPIIATPDAPVAVAAESPENSAYTFTVVDGPSMGGTVRTNFTFPDYGDFNGQYVTLLTTRAATQWGIKLKEMHINGRDEISGISDVIVDAAGEVEFYNLQGVRVQGELVPGLYIRRQGNTATKVLVK